MKRLLLFIKKTGFLFLLLSILVSSSVFCAGKKKKDEVKSGQAKATYTKQPKKVVEEVVEEEPVIPVDKETVVSLPTQKRTFFSKIPSDILEGVENGSPESLSQAMVKIRKNESEYEENEKVLIAVAAEIMKTVWPSEKISWDVFPVSSENSYIGAIDSANKGVFDSSTGNSDFLSCILPVLVLLKPTSTQDVYEPCEVSLKLALSKNSSSVLANYLMAQLFAKKKQPEQAESYYKNAYDKAPEVKEIILAYSKTLRELNKLDLAYQILSSIQTSEVDVLKQNAYLAFAKRDLSAAEEYVARVLQQNPNDLEFLLFRAKILIEKKDYIHAVSLLDMYARQESTSLEYLLLRAKVQLDWSKNTPAATETIEKAMRLYPENSDVYMVAAKISSATDSKIAGYYADELAAKVLEKEPDNIEALSYSLTGLMQRGNWQESYNVCSKIFSKRTPTSDIVVSFITICINLGKDTEAFDFAKSMYAQIPNDEQILQAYIFAYSRTGNRDDVLRYIDSMLETSSPKLKSYLYYRRSFLQTTEESILADLRSSLISNPRNSESLFRLYEIYFRKNDYRKAQYYLRQVVAISPNDATARKLNEELTALINQ